MRGDKKAGRLTGRTAKHPSVTTLKRLEHAEQDGFLFTIPTRRNQTTNPKSPFHGNCSAKVLSMFPTSHLQALQRQICAVLAGSRVSVPCLALLLESDHLRDTAPCLSLFLSFRLFLRTSPSCQRCFFHPTDDLCLKFLVDSSRMVTNKGRCQSLSLLPRK